MNPRKTNLETNSKKLIFLGLVLTFLIALSGLNPAFAQNIEGVRIIDIEIEGTNRTDPADIRRVMSLSEGDRYSQELQRQDLQSIANLGSYNPLNIEMTAERADGGGLKLVVSVQENPIVESITFVGNLEFSAERLIRELEYGEGEILPLAAKSKTRRAIESFYHNGGYVSTSVRVSIESANEENSAVYVTISVDEGERIKIKDLLVEGNKHFSSWHIRTMVSNSGSWLVFNNYYDDEAFDDDLLIIANRYRGDGYLDVRVRRGEFVYDEEKGHVSPKIVIEEGPRYSVNDVQITGRTLFTEEEVSAIFDPMVGKTYDGYKFREAIERLRMIYGNQGYANVQIDGTFQKKPESETVDLILEITENNVVMVGDVIIKTQNYEYEYDLNALEQFIDYTAPGITQESVEREVKIAPGDKFRTADQIRTEERLRRLGIFEKVNVTRRTTDDPNVDDVVVEVQEDPSANFISVSGGVGELSGPAVSLNYINPNLFGDARVLNVGTTLGSRVRSFNIRYLDRYLGDSDTSMDVNLYRGYVEYDGITERTYGSSVEFGQNLSDFNRGLMRLRLERVDLERDNGRLREDTDPYYVAAVRGLFIRDTTNAGRWTHEGYRLTGSVETGWADYFLLKFFHEYESYHALSRDDDWVYHYGHTAGLIPYDSENIGYSERLFLGGSRNLRGFKARGAGPKDEGDRDVNVGGSFLITQRHELRKRFSRRVSGRIFVDAGYLAEEPPDLGSPRVGAGTGVSVDVGPFIIDLDLAGAVVRDGRDRTRVFHFRLRSNY